MRVEFVKIENKGRRLCRWDAVRGKRIRIPGTTMAAGRDLPHDLAQYVVEAAAGIEHGFWGCLARGATFRSTGRRLTRPGRAVIAQHRDDLDQAEALAGAHIASWHRQEKTPVTERLDAALAQWQALGDDDRLVFTWPSPTGAIEP